MTVLLGAGYSCTDEWDSHYEAVTPGEGNGNLWEAISNDPSLSNFKAVLEACNFKTSLDGSQVFTVFAPTNDCFTESKRDSVINLYKEQVNKGVRYRRNEAIKEFVHNHVALYNYSVSSKTSDSIIMMNGKYLPLQPTSLDGNTFVKSNVQTKNGILFSLSSTATYTPNIYEYLRRDADLSNLSDFIYEYSLDEFDASASVPGEIVDGKTQYLDSVTNLVNEFLEKRLGALLNNEDSTYYFVAPTNEVWDNLIAEYETYYQYDSQVKGRDSLMYNYPRLSLLLGTAFSKTQNPEKSIKDSVMSTNACEYSYRKLLYGSYDRKYYQYDAPFEDGGIFNGTEEIGCSNGKIYKASQWNVDKHNIFMFDIEMEGESRQTLDSVTSNVTKDISVVTVRPGNPYYDKVSKNMFAVVEPSGNANYKALFNVRNVLSNVPYDVYVVAVPAVAGDTLVAEAQRTPHKFRCTLSYHDADGKEVSFGRTSDFTTDPEKVDSILIGTYTIPTSSMGLQEAQVKLFIEGRVSTSDRNNGKATQILRMDNIVFKPHLED